MRNGTFWKKLRGHVGLKHDGAHDETMAPSALIKAVTLHPETGIVTRRRCSLALVGVTGVGVVAAVALTYLGVDPPPVPAPLSPTMQTASAAMQKQAIPRRSHKMLSDALHGVASWYGSVLHGHATASGELFDETQMTACHNSLPFGTRVRVTDVGSHRSVVVRINDRGTLAAGRIIDLSATAADRLGILHAGLAKVKLEVLKADTEDLQSD